MYQWSIKECCDTPMKAINDVQRGKLGVWTVYIVLRPMRAVKIITSMMANIISIPFSEIVTQPRAWQDQLFIQQAQFCIPMFFSFSQNKFTRLKSNLNESFFFFFIQTIIAEEIVFVWKRITRKWSHLSYKLKSI